MYKEDKSLCAIGVHNGFDVNTSSNVGALFTKTVVEGFFKPTISNFQSKISRMDQVDGDPEEPWKTK